MYNDSQTTSVATLKAELAETQSHYRTTNSMLAGAKRRGSKADIRELTRAKNRISAKLDSLKSRIADTGSF